MASAWARAYSGGLGAVPPVGSRGKAPGQGVRGTKSPEADNILVLFSIQFSRSGCRWWSSFNQIEMYVWRVYIHTLYIHIAGVGLQEHLLTIFYMVVHQLTRFEIDQNVNRFNGWIRPPSHRRISELAAEFCPPNSLSADKKIRLAESAAEFLPP